MASTSYQANFTFHKFTPSWLDELRSEVNVLFKMMINAIELFTDNPDLTGRDFRKKRRSNPYLLFPDSKSVEVTLMEFLTVVSRIKTLIPDSDSYVNVHKNTATGSITTPYTQTEPRDSYVDFLRIINSRDSKSEPQVDKLSVTFSPKTNYLHQSSPKRKPLRSVSLTSISKIDDNPFTNADLSHEILWETVKSVPKKKKKKSSEVKFSVRKSADTFASILTDGAPRKDTEIKFNRDGDCDELRIVSRSLESCARLSSSSEEEFDLKRYLSEIKRVKSKETVTIRSREFDTGRRKYFDFEDYYDRIMSHSD